MVVEHFLLCECQVYIILFFVTGMFSIDITEDRNCELRLVKKIDHEKQPDYLLKLQLDTLAGLGNPGRTSTMVRLTPWLLYTGAFNTLIIMLIFGFTIKVLN